MGLGMSTPFRCKMSKDAPFSEATAAVVPDAEKAIGARIARDLGRHIGRMRHEQVFWFWGVGTVERQ